MLWFDDEDDGLLRFDSAADLLENDRESRPDPERPSTAEDLADVIAASVWVPGQRTNDRDPPRIIEALILRAMTGQAMWRVADRCRVGAQKCWVSLQEPWVHHVLERVWHDVQLVTGLDEVAVDSPRIKHEISRRNLGLAASIARGLEAIVEGRLEVAMDDKPAPQFMLL